MKHFSTRSLLFTGLGLCIFTACENSLPPEAKSADSDRTQKLMQADQYALDHPDHDYKTIPNSSYILPVEMSTVKDRNENSQAQFALFEKAIPMGGIKLLEWENGMTWQKADGIYKAFIAKNQQNQYIDPFREHGAYEILVRLNLLADSTAEGMDAVHYYLQELIKGKSINTTLIYYCLDRLKSHYPDVELKKIAQKAVKNFEESKRLAIGERELNRMQDMYARRAQQDSAHSSDLRKAISNGQTTLKRFDADKVRLTVFAGNEAK